MSYYNKYSSIPLHESTDFLKYICSISEINPDDFESGKDMAVFSANSTNLNFMLNLPKDKLENVLKFGTMSGNNFVFTGNDGEKYRNIFGAIVPERKVQALKKLSFIMGRLLIGFFINRFADMKLSKFTINKLSNNMKNKKFVHHLQSEIQKVYKKHTSYSPCNASQFKSTPIFNYMLAEYRNRSVEEVAKKVSIKSFDALITAIASNAVTLPASGLLAIPIKALMTYAGVRLNGFGAVYHLITDLGGQVIKMDLILANDGFRLSNMAIFCFDKNGKLIQVDIKDPPYDSYKLTHEEIKSILRKFSKSLNLDIFKKEVKQLCPSM